MENGTGDSGKVSNGLSLDLLFLARYSTVVAHGWGDALFHCTYNTIFHIILLSPGKAVHFDENITTLKACEHCADSQVGVCRCGEQLGSDICGQDTSPSAVSVICHCHICSGPRAPSQSRDLCQVLHTC